MPRGDHRPGCCKTGQACKRIGEPNDAKYKKSSPTPHHRVLKNRIKGWEEVKHPLDAKRRHDGDGNTWRKPGSQRKGNR